MTSTEIDALLRECDRRPPAGAAQLGAGNIELPADHRESLARRNGAEGFISAEQYVMFWPAEEITELNLAYDVADVLTNVVLIGTDGADTGFGYDRARRQYIRTPLIGMEPASVEGLASSFAAMLMFLASA